MIRVLRVLRSSLSAWYYDLFVLIGVNLAWLVLSILIIPLGPATAALFYVAHEVAKGEPISLGLFWIGFRRNLKLSVFLSAAIIIITVLLVANVVFYFSSTSTAFRIIAIMWIYALIFWGMFLNYPNALLAQMEKPSLKKILRNSALLVLDNVGFTVSMSFVTLLVVGLSIFPLGLLPVPLGLFSLLAIFQCKCLLLLLEKYESRAATAA